MSALVLAGELLRVKQELGDLHGREADIKQRLGLLSYRLPPRGWIRPNAATAFHDIGGSRDLTGVRLPSRGVPNG